jgi:hypothetical protein
MVIFITTFRDILIKIKVLIALILCTLGLNAQDYISGIISDSISEVPLPYTHIIIKHTIRGAITNADGYFRIRCSDSDTLVFSFVSYKRKELPCSFFIENKTCYLTPAVNELETVSVYANNDYLFNMLVKARNNLLKKKPFQSKTYFTLETNSLDYPVELLECYFNADIYPFGIKNLILKNGRIGMSLIDEHYFVSLSTTNIISGYDLLNDLENKLPSNPLHLSKSRLKKFYTPELISVENSIYRILFTSKKDSLNYFNCTVWIEANSSRIIKVELNKHNLMKHPLVEINPKHFMDSLNFNLTYTYGNDNNQMLQKIEFNFDFDYDNTLIVRKMKSNGVFLFYDNTTVFDLPYYSIKAASISDYNKIVFQPYNEEFWKNNEVLLPSKKVLEYRNFFNEHGVLLNYDDLAGYYSYEFRQSILSWSEQRLFYADINKNELFFEDPSSRYFYHGSRTTPFFYSLRFEIYLDRNVFDDSEVYLSKTLIKLDESFYFSYIGKNTTGFINVYFDLVEIERREMMDVLERRRWSKNQVDSIYKSTLVSLKAKHQVYLKNAFFGLNEKSFLPYLKQVKEMLDIDNSKLIIDDDFLMEDDDNIFIDLYNYGNVLYSEGKYEQSLEVLLKAYDMGDKHPWLYYNLALNYLVLNDIDNACYFFMKSKEVGQELDPYILKRCSEKSTNNRE